MPTLENESNYETQAKVETIEAENKKFLDYCGLKEDGRRVYGKLESSGVVLNLKLNHFLKAEGFEYNTEQATEANSIAHTRNAFYVSVDDAALSEATDRDIKIIETFPEKEHTTFRVKEIKYGNHNAMWEVLASHMYGLTGMPVPDTKLLVHNDEINEDGTIKIFVASPLKKGYLDMGEFLINNSIRRFIDKENISKWYKEKTKIEKINSKIKKFGITAEEKMERQEMIKEIYNMLPDYFHKEVGKAWGASKFGFNWDFANFELANVGPRFKTKKSSQGGGIEELEICFVDPGNMGAIGFGGKYKYASLNRANTEAKKQSDRPYDYDPALSFSKIELEFLAKKEKEFSKEIKQYINNIISKKDAKGKVILEEEINLIKHNFIVRKIFEELANEEAAEIKNLSSNQIIIRKNIAFKSARHIRPEEATMSTPVTTGLLSLSDIPRNIPMTPLLEPLILEKTKNNIEGTSPYYHDSEIEIAYRLSLITDESIEYIAKKYYLSEEFPLTFPIPKEFKDYEEFRTANGIAKIYKDRRDALKNSVPIEVIEEWILKNPKQSIAARQEVELICLKYTTPLNPDFDNENSGTETIKINRKILRSPSNIIKEIQNHYNNELNNISNIAKISAEITRLEQKLELIDDADIIESIQKNIEIKKQNIIIIEQLAMESTIDFIRQNLFEFKECLDLEPTCSFFKINDIKAMESTKQNTKDLLLTSERIITADQNFKGNQNIHKTNCFIYEKIIKNLQTLEKLQQKEGLLESNILEILENSSNMSPSSSLSSHSLIVKNTLYSKDDLAINYR